MVSSRKNPLVSGRVYHVFDKSIAAFKIFRKEADFRRIMAAIRFYRRANPPRKLSKCLELHGSSIDPADIEAMLQGPKLVEIIAYCIMPTHLHLVLKQMMDNGISNFMGVVLNSYSRYFNTRYKRKGPLWQERFKSVLVEADEELLHLTRYIHLNPVTAYLVNDPGEWEASSYGEYVNPLADGASIDRLCHYSDLLDIDPFSYREFVRDRIDYQRNLAKIKALILD